MSKRIHPIIKVQWAFIALQLATVLWNWRGAIPPAGRRSPRIAATTIRRIWYATSGVSLDARPKVCCAIGCLMAIVSWSTERLPDQRDQHQFFPIRHADDALRCDHIQWRHVMFSALILATAMFTAAPVEVSKNPLQPLDFLVGSCWAGDFPKGVGVDTHCFEPVYGGTAWV